MSYTVEKIDADHALAQAAEYQYALVYRISRITLCKVPNFDSMDWDECFEARFFDEEKELHIYEEDGVLCAVKCTGTVDDDCLVKKYKLRDCIYKEEEENGKEKSRQKYLCVCEHLGYDEDGQAFGVLTRLTGIE